MKDYSKEAQKSTLVKNYLKSRGNKSYEDANVVVGNNGYQLGQKFTLTGSIILVPENKVTNMPSYFALETKEGDKLSLRSLMGISSDKGYERDGVVECERYSLKEGETDTIETYPVECKTIKDFDFKNVWQPPTRSLCDLVAAIEHKGDDLKGKIVTFLGTLGRQVVVRKASPQGFTERYPKGAKRVITARVWSMSDASSIDWDS